MIRKTLAALLGVTLLASLVWAQGLDTKATKDDWEEINFEFNLDVLTDGYPSLLRLAELLQKNPDYKVELQGNADWVGSDAYNVRLGQRRAETVKSFLVKYGARDSQVNVTSAGERNPEADNQTKPGRWMNRRVVITVLNGQGQKVSAGGVGEAINSMTGPKDCCDEILKRLDKLDDIMQALKDLKDQNDRLRADVDALKGAQQKAEAAPPAVVPVTKPEAEQIAKNAAESAANSVRQALAEQKTPIFSILRANIGADMDGGLTFTGAARMFKPFGTDYAIQGQGEYLSFSGRKEAQFDLGLVDRFHDRGQFGIFSSFKRVGIAGMDNGATLGQVAGVLDYIFQQGSVGLFGTKGFLDNQVINSRIISPNVVEENYLRIVDQLGVHTALSIYKNTSMEANIGWMRMLGSNSNKPGGTIRFIQPLNDKIALTVEGGWNETLIGSQATGRIVAGLQFGNFMQPREYLAARHAVPVDVPRIRYEMLTRRVRTGNSPPVADAGFDQIGVAAGPIQLDGSASFDPDEDPITFEWTQLAGPAVSLTGKNTSKATFTAAADQNYSFRLTVTDDKGAKGIDRVNIITKANESASIGSFSASPSEITAGQSATLSWQLNNATSATIGGIGNVDPKSGTTQVSPTVTTTYVLTAKNDAGEVSKSVTVVVKQPEAVKVVRFVASPSEIDAGQASTLSWEVQNATSVTISGIGTVNNAAGTSQVSPTQTTTYTLTAKNDTSEVSESIVVTIRPPGDNSVKIVRFTASPSEITAGQASTLSWEVLNASNVEITGIGNVNPKAGTSQVSPTETTTYTLTAKNAAGDISESLVVTIKVVPQPVLRILSFAAAPASIAAGQAASLSWETENATTVEIDGIGQVNSTGSLTVSPTATTTYKLIAHGASGELTKTATVEVTGTSGGGGTGGNPLAPLIRFFKADKTLIYRGESSTLSWEIAGATEASIDGIGSVNPKGGSVTVSPTTTISFVMHAKSDAGTMSADITVNVQQPPTITMFTASPTSITTPGQAVTLTWKTQDALLANIDGIGQVPIYGTLVVHPTDTTSYTLHARGTRDNTEQTITVTLGTGNNHAPTANAGPDQVVYSSIANLDGSGSTDVDGDQLTYAWTALNSSASVQQSGSSAQVALLGGKGTYVFQLTVTDIHGVSSTDTVSVEYR